jgi:hypothetical protein
MGTSTLIALTAALSGVFTALAMQPGQGVGIDHVILGINDLERGVREFESKTGVAPTRGGEHPGRGTQNALVSLGEGRCLEILAPAATQQPAAPREAAVSHANLTLVGWALHAPALDSLVHQVRGAGIQIEGPIPGSRRAPDGALLAWQSASVDELGVTPFFIEWSKQTPHPSTTSPSGCTLAGMEVTSPSPQRLQLLFKTVSYAGTVLRGDQSHMNITLDCPGGRVEFGS